MDRCGGFRITVNHLRGFSSCWCWQVGQYPNLCVCFFVIKKTVFCEEKQKRGQNSRATAPQRLKVSESKVSTNTFGPSGDYDRISTTSRHNTAETTGGDRVVCNTSKCTTNAFFRCCNSHKKLSLFELLQTLIYYMLKLMYFIILTCKEQFVMYVDIYIK